MLRLAILGDSIAYGIGAAHDRDTLGPGLVARLTAADVAAELRVLATPGARSADLSAQVARCADWPPDIVVLVIGANDLTHFVPPEDAAASLRVAVRELRSARAEVVLAPAPDLSAVPHVPPAARLLVRSFSEQLRQAQIRVTRAEGGRVADADGATTVAFARDASLFAADRFHPSSAGYAVITAALAPMVLAVARTRPARSPS